MYLYRHAEVNDSAYSLQEVVCIYKLDPFSFLYRADLEQVREQERYEGTEAKVKDQTTHSSSILSLLLHALVHAFPAKSTKLTSSLSSQLKEGPCLEQSWSQGSTAQRCRELP